MNNGWTEKIKFLHASHGFHNNYYYPTCVYAQQVVTQLQIANDSAAIGGLFTGGSGVLTGILAYLVILCIGLW